MYLLLTFLIICSITFAVYWHGHEEEFIIGFYTVVIVQLTVLCIYVLNKIRKILSDSKININLDEDFISVEPQQIDYQKIRLSNKKIKKLFLNKYSEEAKLEKKTKMIYNKKTNLGDYESIPEPNINYRKVTNEIIEKIQMYQQILQKFSLGPIRMAQSLRIIGRISMFEMKEYKFITFQDYNDSFLLKSDFTLKQIEVFQSKRIQYQSFDADRIRLPPWKIIKTIFIKMGEIFYKYLNEIKQSNSQLILMTQRKYIEEQEFLLSELKSTERNIYQNKNLLDKLKKQEEEINKERQKHQERQAPENAEMHWEWVYDLKKKLGLFLSLENKIKQTQKQQKQLKQKQISYRKQLQNLQNKHKNNFNKNVKNSFRLFLDGYMNSIIQTIQIFQKLTRHKYQHIQQEYPKVHEPQKHVDPIIALEYEHKYQSQFFRRVNFHLAELTTMQTAIEDLNMLLKQIDIAVCRYLEDYLKIRQQSQQDGDKYTRSYIRWLSEICQIADNFKAETSHLLSINQKFYHNNSNQINLILSRSSRFIQLAQDCLNELRVDGENFYRRYTQIESNLLKFYKQLTTSIDHIVAFKAVYNLHSNRVKKGLLFCTINFIYDQRQKTHQSIQAIDKNYKNHTYDNYQTSELSKVNEQLQNQENKDNKSQNEDEDEQSENEEEPLKVSNRTISTLNKFMFVALLEWSGSQRFKKKIMKILYTTFNEDPSDSFEEIQIKDINLSGPPPQLYFIKILKSEENQALFEINISIRGKLQLSIQTKYNFTKNQQVDLSIKVDIEEVNAVLRICYVPRKIGKGWFSFIGETVQNLNFSLEIQKYNADFDIVKGYLRRVLTEKLKGKVFPMKASLKVPVSKKNKKNKQIKERLNKKNIEKLIVR